MQNGDELNSATGTMAVMEIKQSVAFRFFNDTPARAAPLSAIAMALAAPTLAQLIRQTPMLNHSNIMSI